MTVTEDRPRTQQGRQRPITPVPTTVAPTTSSEKPNWLPASGKVGHPFILLEGVEGSGKTYEVIRLASSDRVGNFYVLQVGEKKADEYGDATVRLLQHDGTYAAIVNEIAKVRAEAFAERAAGNPPVVLCIDSTSPIWEGLSDWVTARAKSAEKAQETLRRDPNADITIGRGLWNDAHARWRQIIRLVKNDFPGIVIFTAKGRVVSATDPATGNPFRDGRKDYSVTGHRDLTFDVDVWVRLHTDDDPQIIKSNNRNMPVRYVKNKRTFREENSEDLRIPRDRDLLEHLIFDRMKYNPDDVGTAGQYQQFSAGDLTDDERADEAREQRAAEASARAAAEREQQVDPKRAHAAAAAAMKAETVETLAAIRARAVEENLLAIPCAPGLTEDAAKVVGANPRVRLGEWLDLCRKHIEANSDSVANTAAAEADLAARGTGEQPPGPASDSTEI